MLGQNVQAPATPARTHAVAIQGGFAPRQTAGAIRSGALVQRPRPRPRTTLTCGHRPRPAPRHAPKSPAAATAISQTGHEGKRAMPAQSTLHECCCTMLPFSRFWGVLL